MFSWFYLPYLKKSLTYKSDFNYLLSTVRKINSKGHWKVYIKMNVKAINLKQISVQNKWKIFMKNTQNFKLLQHTQPLLVCIYVYFSAMQKDNYKMYKMSPFWKCMNRRFNSFLDSLILWAVFWKITSQNLTRINQVANE